MRPASTVSFPVERPLKGKSVSGNAGNRDSINTNAFEKGGMDSALAGLGREKLSLQKGPPSPMPPCRFKRNGPYSFSGSASLRNHSGFWVIAQLIPLLNLVVLLMLLLPSSPYPNYYGLRAPRFPGEKVPEAGADIYGPYGTVAYRPQSNGDETVTQQNQNTPAKGSVMDEIMHENLANADAQAGLEDRPAAASPSKSETHRPMRGEESSLVARLNKLSGK